jgi:hypothetical protein
MSKTKVIADQTKLHVFPKYRKGRMTKKWCNFDWCLVKGLRDSMQENQGKGPTTGKHTKIKILNIKQFNFALNIYFSKWLSARIR